MTRPMMTSQFRSGSLDEQLERIRNRSKAAASDNGSGAKPEELQKLFDTLGVKTIAEAIGAAAGLVVKGAKYDEEHADEEDPPTGEQAASHRPHAHASSSSTGARLTLREREIAARHGVSAEDFLAQKRVFTGEPPVASSPQRASGSPTKITQRGRQLAALRGVSEEEWLAERQKVVTGHFG